MADHSHTALVIVDNQIGAVDRNSPFWGTERSNDRYESNITLLLATFRTLKNQGSGVHIIHIYHSSLNTLSPLHPSNPSMEFHQSSLPLSDEPVISKSQNSAFIDSPLEAILKKRAIWRIYWVGLSVDLCLGSTVRSASDLRVGEHVDDEGAIVRGDMVLVGDGTAAWAKKGGKFDAETVQAVHLESLNGEFARVVTTEEVLRELGVKS